jgi:hypothetical protein
MIFASSIRRFKTYFCGVSPNSVAKWCATNLIGKGTQTIGINMPEKMAEEIEKRANSMHIRKSKYCKIVLQQWIDSGKTLKLGEK